MHRPRALRITGRRLSEPGVRRRMRTVDSRRSPQRRVRAIYQSGDQLMHADNITLNTPHYGRLLLMAVLSYIAMFVLMYAMVDKYADVYVNVNQFYMAGLMAAPMAFIEIVIMSAMYPSTQLNTA